MNKKLTVAVIGNPNVGKSALINSIAGSHLKIGNWPGVTVEKKTATVFYKGIEVQFVDLPGTYSLDSTTQDEIITHNFLSSKDYDYIINIVDINNLPLQLFFTLQLLKLGKPVVLVMNFCKEFFAGKGSVSFSRCSKLLKIPVVPVEAIDRSAKSKVFDIITSPVFSKPSGTSLSAQTYHANAKKILNTIGYVKRKSGSLTDLIDRFLLHPLLGLFAFAVILYFMFSFTYDVSSPFIEWIDYFFNTFLYRQISVLLTGIGFPFIFQSFILDGLIAGIGTVMTFIPLMAFLYFCIVLLEESGYIARVAYLFDRYLVRLGLPGKSIIPLLIGFGCNVPGIYATRKLETEHDKKIVALLMSFMSCGAKLPVYILFASVFFSKHAGFIALILYLFGIGIAVIWGFVFKKWMNKTQPESLLLELPEYRVPQFGGVWNSARLKVQSFVYRAGTVITAVVVLIWALTSLPYGAARNQSMLARVSQFSSVLFVPLGWGNSWEAVASVIPGFLAKEAVIGALTTAYGVQSEKMENKPNVSLHNALKKDFTPLTAFSFLVFNLLLMSCTAVMGAVRQEFGLKYLFFTFGMTFLTAYGSSFAVYQAGRLIGF